MFNAKDGVIRTGDVLAIDKAVRRDVDIKDDPELGSLAYAAVRVETPLVIARNGTKLGGSCWMVC